MIFPPLPAANYAQILAAQAIAAKIEPYAPIAAPTGGETWFEGAGMFPCFDAQAWNQVWDRHIKNEAIGPQRVNNLNPAPDVDFDKNIVVALFAGPTRGIVGYRIAKSFVIGNEGILRIVPVTTNASSASIAIPSPWAFLVLPRTKATLSIQIPRENRWTSIGKVKPSL